MGTGQPVRVRGLGAMGTEEGLRWSPTAGEKLSSQMKQTKRVLVRMNGQEDVSIPPLTTAAS